MTDNLSAKALQGENSMLRRALQELLSAARNMPRETPHPGGASTQHTFILDAARVWANDRACDEAAKALAFLPALAEESSAKAPTSEAVHRVCRVIKGDCLGCPESEMVHGDQCQRGCYAQAVECINTVETGNPWRKTGGVRAPWTVLAPAEARSDRPAPQTYAEAVAAYNAVYDPAFEAGQEVFNAGFREGWMFAVYPDGPDGYEEAAEHYSRSVDGVELGEAWDAHRDAFFARLPLAALPPLPTPPKAEAE